MFDFDAGKLLIIGVLALIVIGPKDLPRVLRQVGQAVGKLRRMAGEFQGQFMDAMKEADLQDIRSEMTSLGASAQLNVNFDPVRDIQSELTQAVSPTVPVATTAEVSHTEGFSLPHLPEPAPDEVSDSVASAGVAPIVVEEVEPAGFTNGSGERLPAKKRKILVPRRRGPAPVLSHSVCDRTNPARLRAMRPRRHEAIEG
jgi:sec-independent protein translocase protein TatB